MSTSHIAFLGLGIMGVGMARRLIGAGFPLTVYNRNRDKAAAFAGSGATVAGSPREAAGNADVVISMVADDAASHAVWLGKQGALAGVRRGAIIVECSTVTPGWIHELAAAATVAGCECVDAPVTGSKSAAAAGELNFLVGGSAEALARIRLVLAPMSRSIVHLGGTGSGTLVKLVNNFVCGVQVVAMGEAMAWLERAGVEQAKALAVLTEGAPGSPLVRLIAGRMTAGDFEPNFRLRLMTKDLGYALREARETGLHLATAKTAYGVFQHAIVAGHGDRDMSAVVEPLRAAGR